MATTRRAPTAHVLVEGQTYNIALPRQTRRLGREMVVASPLFTQGYTMTNGVPVDAGRERAAQQPLVVGSLVRLASSRQQYVPRASLGPTLCAGSTSGTLAVSRFDNRYLYMVVATDGTFMRVCPALFPDSYRNRMVTNDAGLLQWQREQESEWNGSRYVELPPRLLDAEAVFEQYKTSGLRRDMINFNQDTIQYMALARVRHVVEVVDPASYDESVWGGLQRYMRMQAVQGMYDRLAVAEAARRVGAHTDDPRWYRKVNRTARKNAATAVRGYIRSAVTLYKEDPECSSWQIKLRYAMNNVKENMYSERAGGPTTEQASVMRAFSRKVGVEGMRRAEGCNHFHTGTEVRLMGPYMTEHMYCPSCAAQAREVQGPDGAVLTAASVPAYMWSDGLYYFQRESGVIGNRHSGKGVVGYVPPLSGATRESVLTLGLELEMQAFNGNDRETMARAMRTKLKEANVLEEKLHRKYVHFEEDGSTGAGGFEMVTGYTDLETHNVLLKALLCKENGRPAWQGKLRSHDASGESCGIHVHIQKPKHLLHAQKMRYFINSQSCESLIRDVARRYNTSFARMDRHFGNVSADKHAAQALRAIKGGERVANAGHERTAIQRLNSSDRYQALNFQNSQTVEFRIFRGSMMHESVMACIEFTQAVWEFTKMAAATSLTTDNFVEFINRAENSRSTKNLRSYLSRKGWTAVRVAKPAKVGPTTAPATETEATTEVPEGIWIHMQQWPCLT